MYKMDQWEIWQANVPYLDQPGKRSLRPVLIISPDQVLVLKMTTHQHSNHPKPYEYEMLKWEKSGLSAQTYIQCDKFIHLSEDDFTGKKYGRLSMSDIIGVRTMMHYHGLIK